MEKLPEDRFDDFGMQWTAEEEQMIDSLRKIYSGELNDESKVNAIRKSVGDFYKQKMREYHARVQQTGDLKVEQEQIDFIFRFASLLSAAGFAQDAGELLQDFLNFNLSEKSPPLLDREIFVRRMKGAMNEHGMETLRQGMRDLPYTGASMHPDQKIKEIRIYPFN